MPHYAAALLITALLTTAGPYHVDRIACYDGDTCTIDIDLGLDVALRGQTIRLCDINAPELRSGNQRAAGAAARDYLNMLVGTSTAVEVVIPQNAHDSFGRWLAYLYIDGRSVNQHLIQSGHAALYSRTCAP